MFANNKSDATLEKFSVENFDFLSDTIASMKSDAANPQALVDAMRELVEVVVWGDKYNEVIFDGFMEKNTIDIFSEAVESPDAQIEVKVQCFQCFIILLGNLTRQESIYYVMSKNYINRIISSSTLDFSNDEIVSNYISFVKALSLRLNRDLIPFFFQQSGGQNTFPLFECSVRLLDHSDRLVRTSVRQVLVNVMQVKDAELQLYMASKVPQFVSALGKFVLQTLSVLSADLTTQSIAAIDTVMEDINDDLFFLNDLHNVATPEAMQHEMVKALQQFSEPLQVAARENPDALALMSLSNWCRLVTISDLAPCLVDAAAETAITVLSDAGGDNHPIAFALLANALALHTKYCADKPFPSSTTGFIDSVLYGLRTVLTRLRERSVNVVALAIDVAYSLSKVVSPNGAEHLKKSLRATVWRYQQDITADSEDAESITFDVNAGLLYEGLASFALTATSQFNQLKTTLSRVGRDVSYLRWSRGNVLEGEVKTRSQFLVLCLLRSSALGLAADKSPAQCWCIDEGTLRVAELCRYGSSAANYVRANDCVRVQVCAVDEHDASQKLIDRANSVVKGVPIGAKLHLTFVGTQLVLLDFGEDAAESLTTTTTPKTVLVVPLAFACAVVESDRPFRLRISVLEKSTSTTGLVPVNELGIVMRDKGICRAVAVRLNEIGLAARRQCCQALDSFLNRPLE